MPRRALKISEAHIEEACTQMLQLDGWWTLKLEQNYSEKKRKVVGEAGMADRIYARFENVTQANYKAKQFFAQAKAEVMFIEWKSLTGKPGDEQVRWRLKMQKLGALALLAGYDFDRTIEDFRRWYKTSGLMRLAILS